jgi:hypothetical protein
VDAEALERLPRYVASRPLAEAPAELDDWIACWREQGIDVALSDRVRELAERLSRSRVADKRAAALRELILEDAAKETNAALVAVGRPERIHRQVLGRTGRVRPTRWILIGDEDRLALERAGIAHFGPPRRALVYMLSTLTLVVPFWALLVLGITRDGRFLYGAVCIWAAWLWMRRWAKRRAGIYEA